MTDHLPGETIFKLRGVTMNFGNVIAIQNVGFDVARGEIVGLVGDNGAGKSTLVKIMNGFYSPGHGEIEFNGNVVTNYPSLSNPYAAPAVYIQPDVGWVAMHLTPVK